MAKFSVIIPIMQKEECCRPDNFSRIIKQIEKDDCFMVERKIKLTAKEDVKEFVKRSQQM